MWIFSLLLLQLALWIWYVYLFTAYTRAWRRHTQIDKKQRNHSEVCVLIAFRNEEKNLPQLLQALSRQTYPNIQLLFVDDHSEDNGPEQIRAFCEDHVNAEYLSLPEEISGKKEALAHAILSINSPWVLCTDADTRMGADWVSAMMQCAKNTDAVFVSGPVSMDAGTSWFGRWQALEFSGLIAIGAAGIFSRRPTMCNGANIFYLKEAFLAVDGYRGNQGIASGDDQFLMHRINERFPGRVHFCKTQAAVVSTKPAESVKDFVKQRIRWASKNGQFERKLVNMEMVGVWLVTAFLMMNLILGFFEPVFFIAFLLFFLAKWLLERHFYKHILPFFEQTDLIKNFWLAELFHVFYVFGIGLLGKFVRYEWKGRIHGRRNRSLHR